MAGIDKQVRSASAGFADLWERAAPRLAKTHHVKFPGCRMRPVELMEPVALEDVFAGTMRWLQALRDEYTQSKTRLHPKLWTDRQLKNFPSLHEVLHNLNPHPLAPRTEAEWHRRL